MASRHQPPDTADRLAPDDRPPDDESHVAARDYPEDVKAVARALMPGMTRLGIRMRAQPQEHRVSTNGLAALFLLHHHGTMTPGQLAEARGRQAQTLTRTLATLEQDGLIRREADPADRRRYLLELTAAGREVMREDTRRRAEWLMHAMVTELTETEREVLRLAGTLMDRLGRA